MNIRYEKTKIKILAWSIEDWVDLFFFSSIIEEYHRYKSLETLKNATFNFIKDILQKDLMKAGDLMPNNTFSPWNMPVDEIVAKIKSKWDNLNREIHPQEIVWFDITEKGKKEFEYLDNLPELKKERINYYIRICEGGQKAAEEMVSRLTNGVELIKSDNLKKFKVYKLSDDTYISYRQESKFKITVIDIHFSEINKTLQFQYRE
ncbi:MAG: hypothetical protein HZB76_03915 [Chlamydiae bacterium]|nr:hypothetical protein [Chlamydiota bacterium]